jgi:lipopolysaccharide transport system ATP-binding protein
MSKSVLRTEKLGKQYRVGTQRAAYGRLSESLTGGVRRVVRGGRGKQGSEYLWALRDASFEVAEGEVVGVIGRNGAGKTTLLKLISEITEPTEGRIGVNGRVGSLLEVGTGFHPELTGRENIFLNGAILGMPRREIVRKFDQIVDFAEIGTFLDTPVKRYSSGMYIRLAFAVAAHLEPEILIVDEVLAVGDVAFQQKCLGKMGDVARQGLTVLLVSHNMAIVSSLCPRSLWLQNGRLVADGPSSEVIDRYLASVHNRESVPLAERTDRTGEGGARLVSVSVDPLGAREAIDSLTPLRFTIRYEADGPLRYPSFLVGIYDHRGICIFFLDSAAVGGLPDQLPGEGVVVCETAPTRLTAGPCSVNLALLRRGAVLDHVTEAASFNIVEADPYGNGRVPLRGTTLVMLDQEWRAEV